MAKTFTDAYVRYLKATDREVEFREGQGFAIRVLRSGVKSWQFIYTFHGRRRRMSLGIYPNMSLAEARAAHAEARALLMKGIDPAERRLQEERQARAEIEARNRAATMRTIVDEYLQRWAKANKKSWREDQRMLELDVLPVWGCREAASITRRDVIEIIDRVVDRGSPSQANRLLSVLKRMFQFAVSRDLVENSPAALVEKPHKETTRDCVLADHEIRHLWIGPHRITPWTHAALKMILITAQRPGEVRGITWSELEKESGCWVIPGERVKNGITQRVPLSPLAVEILDEMRGIQASNTWVFPSHRMSTNGPIRGTSIANSARRLSGAAWTPHDLRRSAATGMSRLGYSRLVIDKVLNHVDGSVGAVYDRHSYDDEKRQALEAWARKLGAIVSGADIQKRTVVEFRRP